MPAARPLLHLAHDLAAELSGIAGTGCALVVLAGAPEPDHVVAVGPCDHVTGSLVDLVLSTEPAVCAAERTHDADLRRLARSWHADHLLVAPCTFGHDLLAVTVAPLGDLPDLGAALRAAADACERTAAAIMRLRIFGPGTLAASA